MNLDSTAQPKPPQGAVMEKPRQNNMIWLSVAIVMASLILSIGGVVCILLMRGLILSDRFIDGNLAANTREVSVSDIVDKVSPSVVSIVTNGRSQSLFGDTRHTRAAGTGIIISKDGYILTNKHVVSNAQSVTIVASDGSIYDSVSLIGTDPLNDLAYLKIKNVNNLTPASIGNSSTARVGQSVIAIGNALGQYQNTVSKGIISGKGRVVSAGNSNGEEQESLTDMIQTDTAINSGNSGGPLINYSGQVIGINTAVASGAEGIGFSIPINAAKGTIKQVLAGKGVQRAYLGVNYTDITPELAKHYNLPSKYGAYVARGRSDSASVTADSPAAKAGLQDKDIITKVNGVELGPQGNLSSALGQYQPGDSINLTVIRGGRTIVIKVTLAAYREYVGS